MNGKGFFAICFIIAVGVIVFAHYGNVNFEESDILSSVKESTEDFTNSTIDKAKEKIGFKIDDLTMMDTNGLKLVYKGFSR